MDGTMSVWFIVWFTLAGGVGLVWIFHYSATIRVLYKRRILSSRTYNGPPMEAPKVSIVVAAKDEEKNIETCVTGLLEQDYPNYELIVVDDRSRDRTPDILQRLLEQAAPRLQEGKDASSRLRVVTVKTLRDGWFGKHNAMCKGVALSTGEWFLFTDADCRYTSRNTLSMAMREALAEEVDFLCITPVLDTFTAWERIVQPVCSIVLMAWFLPHHVNKPKSKKAYANGAFMLMRRSTYEAIGGHEAVRNEIAEDVHMARLTRKMGMRLRVVENDDLCHTRMYDSPLAAWHGWSRIFYGCLGSLTRLSVAVSLLVVLSIIPWVSLVVALVGCFTADADGAAPWGIAARAWLAVLMLMQLVTWRLYAILRADPVWSLTYILGALVTLGMLISAILKVLGATRTTWRGTTYRSRRFTEPRKSPPRDVRVSPLQHAPGSKPVEEPAFRG